MRSIEVLFQRLEQQRERAALHDREREISMNAFLDLVEQSRGWLEDHGAVPGSRWGIVSEFTPLSCAMLLALLKLRVIAVPLQPLSPGELEARIAIAQIDRVVHLGRDLASARVQACGDDRAPSPLLASLIARGEPGIVVFSSGSTGAPKGVLHDASVVVSKFLAQQRRGYRTLMFLRFHHIGGLNTLFGVLAYGGVAVFPAGVRPSDVASMIERARVELLPTTPSFLALLLASNCHRAYDLSSLAMLTYGAEPMPAELLERVRQALPAVRLRQTYGLSELGIVRTRSHDDGSLRLQIGGEGFRARVEDGTLWVKSDYAMLGYLNASSPFDADGWMNTGDKVEVSGNWLRILGRESDMINIAGEKVFPAEIESVLLSADNVADAVVHSERDALVGMRIVARVVLGQPEAADELRRRLRQHCAARMERYKIPVKFYVEQQLAQSDTFKRMRPGSVS